MGKIVLVIIGGFLAILSSHNSSAIAASAVSIQYGIVEHAMTIKQESSHAGGAVVGGLLGAAFSGPRRRGLKIMGSAAAGAAIQGAATGGVVQQYSVKLRNGGQVMVSTEQQEIREGDCVSVEQGDHTNIRRASSIHCEERFNTTTPAHHESAASNCDVAKKELMDAKTDQEINNAAKKARILCED